MLFVGEGEMIPGFLIYYTVRRQSVNELKLLDRSFGVGVKNSVDLQLLAVRVGSAEGSEHYFYNCHKLAFISDPCDAALQLLTERGEPSWR